jgi:hypothetical protein
MHPILSIQLGKIRARDLAQDAACRRTQPRRRRLPATGANPAPVAVCRLNAERSREGR